MSESTPLRIGIFSESYAPVKNGVAVSVRTLVDELRSRHHHVCILAPHYPDYEDESPFVLRVPSMLSPLNPDYPVPYPWFPHLRREIHNLQLNVLHSQSPWFLGLLAARIARQYGLPHVSTYHTLYHQYAHYVSFLPGQATHGLMEWWLPQYYNACACVIVPSKVAEQSLRDFDVTGRITVIPTGVPLPSLDCLSESARRQARERWSIPPDAPLLLYVGRVAREKNVELVIDSFGRIAEEFPEARLLVVGSGPQLPVVTKHAESVPGSERVIFAGAVDRGELDPVYAAADLFVFGSVTETQGLVVAEARAAGTPAVVVDEGGAAETVTNEEDGLVVKADSEAMAAGIRALLVDSKRRLRMRQACQRNARNYTPGAMAERVVDVYRAAMETGTARSGAAA